MYTKFLKMLCTSEICNKNYVTERSVPKKLSQLQKREWLVILFKRDVFFAIMSLLEVKTTSVSLTGFSIFEYEVKYNQT